MAGAAARRDANALEGAYEERGRVGRKGWRRNESGGGGGGGGGGRRGQGTRGNGLSSSHGALEPGALPRDDDDESGTSAAAWDANDEMWARDAAVMLRAADTGNAPDAISALQRMKKTGEKNGWRCLALYNMTLRASDRDRRRARTRRRCCARCASKVRARIRGRITR